jgi:ABC-type bacteriocin/lantibiotic exporter with double-glycine peptidase domain
LNASYIFLNRTGHHEPYEQLAREFASQPVPDSMLAIRNVLEQNGCATIGVKADPDFFLDNKGPAIVHLQLSGYSLHPEDHFSFLVGASRQTGVEVLDPVFNVKAAAYITWLTFAQSYQGAALILK